MKVRRWLDPRLLIGLVLVLVSVASVAFVVKAANRTTEVWTIAGSAVPGDVLEADDVVLARVQLERAGELYHLQDQSPIGMRVTRALEPGELIPRSAVSDAAITERSRVVIAVEGVLPAGSERGATVDVWASVAVDRDVMSVPEVLVDNAVVAAVHSNEGLMTTSPTTQVELLVPRDRTPALLHALAEGHVLHLVPDPAGSAP